MSGDTLDLKKFVRTVENFPIDGITFRDVTALLKLLRPLLRHVMN